MSLAQYSEEFSKQVIENNVEEVMRCGCHRNQSYNVVFWLASQLNNGINTKLS